MRRALLFAPLALLLAFVVLVAWRLVVPEDRAIRSKMVGRPVPSFALPAAVPDHPALASADLTRGGPRLVNVFASWCVPCIAEAPLLIELKRSGIPIDAIAIRDRPQDVADFLARHGDPFDRIGSDVESRVQLALGSSGVPETFLVDGRGVIRYQHVGPIEPGDVPQIRSEWAKAE